MAPTDDDDRVSEYSQSTNLDGSLHGGNAEIEEAIAKQETRFVQYMRLLVLFVLVVATAGAGYAVHSYLQGSEEDAFKEEFQADAGKVMASIGQNLDLTLTALDAFTITMVSYAKATNASWPFVTIPDFEVRAAKIRALSKAVYISNYLIVQGDEREQYQDYAEKHGRGWVDESVAVQKTDPNYYGPFIDDYYVVHDIHNVDEEPMPKKDLYYPIWQSSPAIPRYAAYNWDGLSWSDTSYFDAIYANHKVQLGNTYHLPDPEDEEAMAENAIDVDWFSDYVKPGQNASEPVFDISYPILDTVDRVTIVDPKNYTLCGTAAVSIFWKNLLEDILPDGSNGAVAVFDNPCNPSFTFQIDGPEVVFLGRGDLHNSKYDNHLVQSLLADLNAFASSSSSYSGIDVDEDFCPTTIRMYPSESREDSYMTSTPLALCFLTVSVFLFTAMVFIVYDLMVEKRQKKVMKTATKTSAIVSSLFPSTVRDRMYAEQEEAKKEQKQKGDDMLFHHFPGHEASNAVDLSSPPIADLFEETTIFFADLKGFTAWSSNRTPTDVFHLLETVYGAFDEIARQRRIFKVETIGDCYVAAAGLPTPQHNHSTIMVRFARDCMMKMSHIVNDLAETIGEDTRDLQMRVGLHSGATTAGVLRGEKGRFQLFGDTVNTASRMESNGVAGKIHVSQATADRLIAQGKGSWLVERPDKIVAKGKGEMQTYFVVGSGTKSAYTSGGDTTISGGTGVGAGDDDEFDEQKTTPNGEMQVIEAQIAARFPAPEDLQV